MKIDAMTDKAVKKDYRAHVTKRSRMPENPCDVLKKDYELYLRRKQSTQRSARYMENVMTAICIVSQQENPVVGIEGYITSVNPETDSMLVEQGGFMRCLFALMGVPVFEFKPSSVKKQWSNNGRAKKHHMVKAYHLDYKLPSLYELMGREDKGGEKVPKGMDDVVDSVAVTFMTACEYFGIH
jgi:hypothetical protein